MIAGDGPAEAPVPMSEDLRGSFTEAVWRTVPWQDTTWLGHSVDTPPTDLLAYQEIIADVRPDWIIEIGTGDGGRTAFLASICDLVGHGQIVSIDRDRDGDLPEHPRITYLRGRSAHRPPAVAKVRDTIGDPEATAVVILGARADRPTTMFQFEAYAPFVPVGSYVIVTDTIVNGNPVWPAFGPGPAEAVKRILARSGDFIADPKMEKYSLTFNRSGYLRRIS